MSNPDIMAKRIKEKRTEMGLTMEELGSKVGVQKSAVNKWEKGHVSNMKRSTIEKLAEIFGCSPAWLMGMTGTIQVKLKSGEVIEKEFDLPIDRPNYTKQLIINSFKGRMNKAIKEEKISPISNLIYDTLRGMTDSQVQQVLNYAAFIKTQGEKHED